MFQGAVNLSEVNDVVERNALRQQIACFGQTPMQLFRRAHPQRNPPLQALPPPMPHSSTAHTDDDDDDDDDIGTISSGPARLQALPHKVSSLYPFRIIHVLNTREGNRCRRLCH